MSESLFFDYVSARYFTGEIMDVFEKMEKAIIEGWMLNDWYDSIGIPRLSWGDTSRVTFRTMSVKVMDYQNKKTIVYVIC